MFNFAMVEAESEEIPAHLRRANLSPDAKREYVAHVTMWLRRRQCQGALVLRDVVWSTQHMILIPCDL